MMNHELYHYGMPRRSGRYPWGSGERPYQSSEDKLKRKTSKKLNKIEAKRVSQEKVAEKLYAEAEKKSLSRWSSQRKVDRAFDTATAAKRKADVLVYKGSEYYKKQSKKFDKLNVNMDSEIKDLGEKYIKMLSENTAFMYTTSFYNKRSRG